MFLLKTFVALAILSSGASYAIACPSSDSKEATSEVAKLSVDEAAKLLKQGKVIMVDANGTDTRQKVGFVPGARLLSSHDEFDAKELKARKDQTLVFYCYNEMCSAAPSAAATARAMGFKTRVMDAGIIGWKKAGNAVKKLKATNS